MRRAHVVALLVLVMLASLAVPSEAQPAPEAVGSSDWVTISSGDEHTCGVRTNGRLYCWGSNSFGKLGSDGPNSAEAVPVEVAGGFTTWASVSAGDDHTCALRTNGRLYCWGHDGAGRLGNGATTADQFTPVLVHGGITNWTSVSAGDGHTCARRAPGRLYCWGDDGFGALGNGGMEVDRSVPTLVAGGATDWTAVSVGGRHSCARRASGRLYCWGLDIDGQLGNGAGPTDRSVPTQVAGGATNWRSVSAGSSHTCAVRTTGRAWCWGADFQGGLGNGAATGSRFTPVLVAGPVTNWSTINAGGLHTCARRATGQLYCWGLDADGQVGDGGADLAEQPVPTQVGGGARDWLVVDAGGEHTCARTTSRRAYCWGEDTAGQVGDGTPFADQSRPGEVFVP